jgi:hypothetical protein
MQPVRVAMAGTSRHAPAAHGRRGGGDRSRSGALRVRRVAHGGLDYGNAEVDRAAITYDWATDTFDYDQRFEDALFAGEGPGTNWVTEYAMPLGRGGGSSRTRGRRIDRTRRWARRGGRARGVLPAATRSPHAPAHPPDRPNDIREDLTLRISSGGEIGNLIEVTRELNRAPEPVCPVCESSDGLSPGGPSERGRGSTFRCAIDSGAPGGASWSVVLFGLVVLVLRRRAAVTSVLSGLGLVFGRRR